MDSPTICTLAISLLLFLNNPHLNFAEDPLIVQNFTSLLQNLGFDFFETSQPLQPAVDSPLRVPSALSQPSVEDAEYYLYFAYAAYCSPESIQQFTCSPCLNVESGVRVTAFIQNPIFNTRAFVAINDVKKEIIVSFRGTENVPNAIEDLILIPGPTEGPPGIRVHTGFYKATNSIYSEIVAAVKDLTAVNLNYPIKVTGHSLGGAEAIIATYLFKVKNEFPASNSLSLFTYGQPRVGNVDFADYINSIRIPFARVVQKADLIVHAVPALLGYMHTQNELFVNVTAASARYCNTEIYEDPTCSNSYGPLYSPLDHLYYFNIPALTCFEEDPYSFAIQFLEPLQQFIPLIPGSSPTTIPAYLFPYIISPLQTTE